MNIQSTGKTIRAKKLNSLKQKIQPQPSPGADQTDSFTFSSDDNAGWKLSGLCVGLASLPLAIGTRSPALAVVGLIAGVAIAFGPDD